MSEESTPRIRLVPVPDHALLVVRGGVVGPSTIRADAERFRRRYPDWGRYGVSAFLAADYQEVHVLCETRLERFRTLTVYERSALRNVDIEIVPTFRRPHVTLAHPDLDALVSGLESCEHRELNNPYTNGWK